MAADCALDSVDQVRVNYLVDAYCIIEFSRHFLIVLGPKTRFNVDCLLPRVSGRYGTVSTANQFHS